MERVANPITEVLEIIKERKRVKLSALAYRVGLSQRQVLDILDALEREKAISRAEEEGEIVVHALDLR
jgi:DNA-binding IclR family transcriptional regulator